MQKTIVVLTDCEPDDLFAIGLLLANTESNVFIGVTSPDPDRHAKLVSEFVSQSAHKSRVEVHKGSKYSRNGKSYDTDASLHRALVELVENCSDESIDLVFLTTPYDWVTALRQVPHAANKVKSCYMMGGLNEEGRLGFNWRICPASVLELLAQGVCKEKLHLLQTRTYRKHIGTSLNANTFKRFIPAFLSGPSEGVAGMLKKAMYEFDNKNATRNAEVRKLIPVGEEGKQICPADIFTVATYLDADTAYEKISIVQDDNGHICINDADSEFNALSACTFNLQNIEDLLINAFI